VPSESDFAVPYNFLISLALGHVMHARHLTLKELKNIVDTKMSTAFLLIVCFINTFNINKKKRTEC